MVFTRLTGRLIIQSYPLKPYDSHPVCQYFHLFTQDWFPGFFYWLHEFVGSCYFCRSYLIMVSVSLITQCHLTHISPSESRFSWMTHLHLRAHIRYMDSNSRIWRSQVGPQCVILLCCLWLCCLGLLALIVSPQIVQFSLVLLGYTILQNLSQSLQLPGLWPCRCVVTLLICYLIRRSKVEAIEVQLVTLATYSSWEIVVDYWLSFWFLKNTLLSISEFKSPMLGSEIAMLYSANGRKCCSCHGHQRIHARFVGAGQDLLAGCDCI